MQSRSRSDRSWPIVSRVGFSSRWFHFLHSGRSIALAIRCLELCLLIGILLAFVAGMVRIR